MLTCARADRGGNLLVGPCALTGCGIGRQVGWIDNPRIFVTQRTGVGNSDSGTSQQTPGVRLPNDGAVGMACTAPNELDQISAVLDLRGVGTTQSVWSRL